MAHSSAKSRLVSTLARSRTSSPNNDEYATADSFDLRNEQILHSTLNMDGDNHAAQQNDYYDRQSVLSDGTVDMSIEIGRGGMKRGPPEDEVSSQIGFNFGGDSQIDFTPPIGSLQASARKPELGLRKEVAVREAAKSNDALKKKSATGKYRSLSATLSKMHVEDEITEQATATFNTRNTRFMRPRQVSGPIQDTTPRRQPAADNPTVQSAAYTAKSFALPDLPNITELVSGVRKDGTPVFNRVNNKPRSRFASGNFSKTQHIPIDSVPIPDDEKAIYASLQLLKDKVAGLERDNSAYQKRSEKYESEKIDLRSQLEAERRRPDSALGSDDGAEEKWRAEKTWLQAQLKGAQDRLDRAERKSGVAEIAKQRVVKERDDLITQIGVAYYSNEELKAENDSLNAEKTDLEAENEALRSKVERLTALLGGTLSDKMDTTRELENVYQSRQRTESMRHTDCSPEKKESTVRSKKEAKAAKSSSESRQKRRHSSIFAEAVQEDIATRIAKEVQRHRADGLATKTLERSSSDLQTTTRTRSKSRSRRQEPARLQSAGAKRAVLAPADVDASSEEESTGREITSRTRETLRNMCLPVPQKARVEAEDSRDITLLSYQDPKEVLELRKKLEEELWVRRRGASRRSASEIVRDETAKSTTTGMQRKSSLKEPTTYATDGTGRFSLGGIFDEARIAKTVRVQSPHTSDASILPHAQQQEQQQQQPEILESEVGETSFLSNTSRRRRHARAISDSEAGMTSAFILPDITLHGGVTQPIPASNGGKRSQCSCVEHKASACILCTSSATIAMPIPVSSRSLLEDPDVTTATIRPSQPPDLALAEVIKKLEDEIVHLKLQLEKEQAAYNSLEPALGWQKRKIVKTRMDELIKEVEKRSAIVYGLYDVLEGQKEAKSQKGGEEKVEETAVGNEQGSKEKNGGASRGFQGLGDYGTERFGAEELEWEGLSEDDGTIGSKRRSGVL